MSTYPTELRTDFTADTADLERGTRSAAEALGDVEGALHDVADESALTDRQLENLADELATVVRRAERAEGKVRDLRGELRKLKDAAGDLDGKNVDIDVNVDVDQERLGGMFRRLRSRFKLEQDTLGRGLTAALGPALDNDIATAIGGAFAKIPPEAQLAIAAIVAVGVAMSATTLLGLAAGAALGLVGKWLYGQNPDSPMAQTVRDVKAQFDTLATTLADVLQPAFDTIATVAGPILIDMMRRLKDWIVNNRDTVQTWAVDFAKAFLTGVEVATYLGQALIKLAQFSVIPMIGYLGGLTEMLGYVIRAMEWITHSGTHVGQSFIDSGNDAQTLANDLKGMGDAGYDALGAIRDGAKEARTALDDIPDEHDITIGVTFSAAFLNIGNTLASVLPSSISVPVVPRAASGRSGDVPAPTVAPIINVRVDGGDPRRVVQAIERYAGVYGGGATVVAP